MKNMKKALAIGLITVALVAMPVTAYASSPSKTPEDPGKKNEQTAPKTADPLALYGLGAAALAGVSVVASKKK